jgi:hypothetical protein
MVDIMMFMLPSVNDDIHRLLKERRLAEALDVNLRHARRHRCRRCRRCRRRRRWHVHSHSRCLRRCCIK